ESHRRPELAKHLAREVEGADRHASRRQQEIASRIARSLKQFAQRLTIVATATQVQHLRASEAGCRTQRVAVAAHDSPPSKHFGEFVDVDQLVARGEYRHARSAMHFELDGANRGENAQ